MRDKQPYVTTNRLDDTGLTNYMDQAGRFELLNAEQEVDLAQQIEAGIYATHLLEADQDRQEYDQDYKQALGMIAMQGYQAREHLISANTRLAINKAKKYKHVMFKNDFSDLINNANLGLIEAATTFDYKRGLKFSTYAGLLIEQYLYHESNNSDRTIRVPITYLRQCHDINKVRRDYELIHGYKPSDEYVAEQLQGVSVQAIALADQRLNTASTISLDHPATSYDDDDNLSLIDTISNQPSSEDLTVMDIISNRPSGENDRLFETEFEQQIVFKKVNHLIDENLAAREALIIRLHYGFLGEPPMNFQAIGDELYLSRERVRVLHKQSIATLLALPEMVALKSYFEA